MSETTKQVGHTPGPWQAEQGIEDEPDRWSVVTENGAHFVAEIQNGAPGDTLETEGANARLIAAAPDMLAALKLPEPSGGCFCDDCRKARAARSAAIAKAEGTS